jgi:hypothetical protein
MTWTERYLGAALRSIPEPKRADVERELRSSIEDGIEERVGAGEDRTAAERAVLEGLGDPSRLAAAYTGKPNYLIGPELFPIYRHVVPRILGGVVPVVGLILTAVTLADGGTIADSIAAGISAAVMTAIQILFWSTVVFVFLERADAARQAREEVTAKIGTWSVERLPEAPKPGVSVSDTIGEIFAVGATAIGLLVAQTLQVAGATGSIQVVHPSLNAFWIPFLLAMLVALAVIHVFVYTVGRWTMGFVVMFAVVEVAWAAPIVWLALKGTLINPAFAAHIGYPALSDGNGTVMLAIAIISTVITAWEIFDAYRKSRRAQGAGALLAATLSMPR